MKLAERDALAERRANYVAAKERAVETLLWGPYEVLIFRRAAHVVDVYKNGDFAQKVKMRVPTRWTATAYEGIRRAYGARELLYESKAKALQGLREEMVRALDRLPARIEFLEAEERRLREALY